MIHLPKVGDFVWVTRYVRGGPPARVEKVEILEHCQINEKNYFRVIEDLDESKWFDVKEAFETELEATEELLEEKTLQSIKVLATKTRLKYDMERAESQSVSLAEQIGKATDRINELRKAESE